MPVTLPTGGSEDPPPAAGPVQPPAGPVLPVAALTGTSSTNTGSTNRASLKQRRRDGSTLSVVNDGRAVPDHGSGPDADRPAVPVFTDPTGHRQRLIRRIGVSASIFLVGALILVAAGLFGGPRTPFSLWGAPRSPAHGQPGAGPSGARPGRHAGPGATAPGSTAPSQRPGSSRHPSPSPSSAPSPSPAPTPTPGPTSSGSPAPTNPAGHTPPGRNHSKKPHPTKSPHAK